MLKRNESNIHNIKPLPLSFSKEECFGGSKKKKRASIFERDHAVVVPRSRMRIGHK